MSGSTVLSARVVAIVATRNGFVIEQHVRTDANGSRYTLRGSDMVEGGAVGDEVHIRPSSGGNASRVA